MGNCHNRWTVLSRAANTPFGQAQWLCRCDCGVERIVDGKYLRNGASKSCGCLQRETASLPRGEASFNYVVRMMKRNAKTRGHKWYLTKEQVRFLTQQRCHYCGTMPAQTANASDYSNGAYVYNGIDRVDNNEEYTIDNVVSCCKICNAAKSARDVEDFAAWTIRVYEHWANNRQGHEVG